MMKYCVLYMYDKLFHYSKVVCAAVEGVERIKYWITHEWRAVFGRGDDGLFFPFFLSSSFVFM